HPEYVDAIWGSGDPPAAGSGVGTNRDYLPFAIQEGWNAPPGPVHNIDKGTDHHMIQWAIDNATSGDRIIVDDKTYFENLVIDKALDIRASAMNAVIDGGNTGHVIEIIADNVVLEGFKVQNSGLSPGDSGIRLNGFDHCSILDNNITGTDTAISLMSSSDNNTIINNTFIGNEMGVNSLGSWNDIYHNNFIANTVHVEDSGYNEWDMGFPIGGNFWDNWTTPDADMDGFVDDPFIITTGSGGGTPLDLGGYRIEQYGSSLTWTFTAGDLVQPEGYIVIGRLADKASFESFWGVTLGADVLYIDANNVAGSTFLVINGGETFELFDDISISIDGPTGYTMVSGNSAQRTATTDEGTLVGSWNIVSRDLATPGSGASGDTSAGLVVNEYSDAASYQYEFIELYYDSPISGGAGSNNQDNWPFTIQDDWLTSTISNHTIILEEGWNLISTPFANADPSIDNVLADINGKWDYILAYDASEPSNHWKSNATFKPQQLNDLLSLDHEMGFWINITEAGASLFLEGYEVQTTIQLRAGWNLIGYPTLNNNTTIAEALAGTGYTMVEGFNATAPYHVEVLADNYVMKPGEGYWVHVPADTGWVVDW
ncbi:MAG: right-handed parallel beta-helix repeat-containing protein, partial [Thermoplasmata archaeon]|nr:right-handed parallel beta-helix repeat-containing protein [Thermoplasmata archaeon]